MNAVGKNLIKLEGSVDNVMFSNPENGYTVLDLDAGGELIPVVGELGNVDAGRASAATNDDNFLFIDGFVLFYCCALISSTMVALGASVRSFVRSMVRRVRMLVACLAPWSTSW